MKDYFSHDYNSRNDKKLVKAFMKFGLESIGAYWCIVEMLYEEGGYLPLSEYERITFELRSTNDTIKYLINDSELFKNDGIKFWSETAIDRLKLRSEKSDKARKSIESRWNKINNTNVIRTNEERNTIKVKESKENINKIKADNISNWKNDFEFYKSELRKVYKELISDVNFISDQEKFNPNVDIKLSIEKACTNFWATEAGWNYKKKSRIKEIDWKSTLTNAISMNKVYKNTIKGKQLSSQQDLSQMNYTEKV